MRGKQAISLALSCDGPARETLFDDFERTDSSPMRNGESIFRFYNRVNRPEWARVRDELESWYCYHPDPDGQLRDHFRGKRHDQHLGAWWELYVFTFYRKLGYEVTMHPELPNGRPDKPDFLIRSDESAAYVECKAVIERSRTALEAAILDVTNTASHPDFILELDIDRAESTKWHRADNVAFCHVAATEVHGTLAFIHGCFDGPMPLKPAL